MFNRNVINGLLIAAFLGLPLSYGTAQVVNPGIQQSGAVTAGHCVKWGPGIGQASDAGADCAAAPPSAANPTATAGPAAVNGVATTYMRSDAAPAVQLGTNAAPGIVQADGTSIKATAGVISGALGANPTATASSTAVNGTATTFMRSDAAPAVNLASNAQAGIMRGDTTSITCTSGVCHAVAVAANPTATAGPAAVNGVATTYMRSDAAPAVQLGTNAVQGIVSGDGTTVSCVAGVCSSLLAHPNYQSQVFTASATFTTPIGSTTSTVYHYKMLGGGGGGGGSNGSSVAGGGACGAYAEGTFTGIAPSTGISITVGAFGAGGTSAGTTGSAGTASSIGVPVSITAGGGGGGIGVTTGAGNGGVGGSVTGTPNMLSVAGGHGFPGRQQTSTPAIVSGGDGCTSILGAAGVAGSASVQSAAIANATGYGAGGGGGIGNTAAGSNGSPGLVIIDYVQ